MKSKGILFLATIAMALMLIVSVSATTYYYHPTSGNDTTPSPNPLYHVLTPSDLAKVETSNDVWYINNGSWFSGYQDTEYLEYNFSPNLRECNLVSTKLKIEWHKNTAVDEVRVSIPVSLEGWLPIWLSRAAGEDRTDIIDLSSWIDSLSEINNFKIRFQAMDNDNSGNAFTYHDLVEFQVECDNEEPDTNISKLRNIELENEKLCIWNGTHFRSFVPYNQIITYGFSIDDIGVKTTDNSPQYVWDSLPITGWTNLIVYEGNNGDPLVRWRTSQGDWNLQTLIDGEHRVCGRAKDIFNRQENPGNGGRINVWELPNDDCCDVCVDRIAPTADKPEAQDIGDCYEGFTNKSEVTFTWDYDITGCADIAYFDFFVEIDDGGFNVIASPTTNSYTLDVNDGHKYRVKIRPTDKAGNEGPESDPSDYVYVDQTNPVVNITSPTEVWHNNDFIVSEDDSDSNLLECQITIQNNGNLPYVSGWSISICNADFNVILDTYCHDDGTCTITKEAKDKACNIGEDTKRYLIDRTPPTPIKNVSEPKEPYSAGDWYVTNHTVYTFDCDDGNGNDTSTAYWELWQNGVWLLGNHRLAPTTETFDIPYGPFEVHYWCADGLGNTGEPIIEPDFMDNRAPTTTKDVTGPSYGNNWYYVSSESLFHLDCDDREGVGCDYIRYNYNGTWITVSGNSTEFNLIGNDGIYTLQWYSVDKLGNTEETHTQLHFLDNTIPTIEIENPDSPLGCAMLQFDVIAKITDDGSGIDGDEVYARIDDGEWVKMNSLGEGSDRWYVAFSNMIDSGFHDIEVKAQDNVENENSTEKEVEFLEDIYWEVEPEYCELNWQQGGDCSFRYRMTLCHGGDEVAMAMHKLCCQTWLNPKLDNWETSVFVRELFKDILPFWYEASLQEEFLPGWCNNQGTSEWNYITLANFINNTGDLRLNFTLPALQSGGMCEKMYYAVKTGDGANPRAGYFDVDWLSLNRVRFSPHGTIYDECGNGIVESDEQCDGSNLNGKTCQNLGYDQGTLACSQTCRFDSSSCSNAQGGGGGRHSSGGSGGGNSCSPQWQCTPWGTCINELKFRVCTDINECGTLDGKPTEKSECEITKSENSLEGNGLGNSDINSQENSNNGKSPFTGFSIKDTNPIIGGTLFVLIVALVTVITIVAKRLILKNKQ